MQWISVLKLISFFGITSLHSSLTWICQLFPVCHLARFTLRHLNYLQVHFSAFTFWFLSNLKEQWKSARFFLGMKKWNKPACIPRRKSSSSYDWCSLCFPWNKALFATRATKIFYTQQRGRFLARSFRSAQVVIGLGYGAFPECFHWLPADSIGAGLVQNLHCWTPQWKFWGRQPSFHHPKPLLTQPAWPGAQH